MTFAKDRHLGDPLRPFTVNVVITVISNLKARETCINADQNARTFNFYFDIILLHKP